MSVFARVSKGIVQDVILADADFVATLSAADGSRWIEATPEHKNDPSVGMLYDEQRRIFLLPQPSPDYTFDEDANTWVMPSPEATVRNLRDELLAASDWVITKAVEQSQDGLGIQIPVVWLEYRQALRDVPQQAGFPHDVIWPTMPE